MNKSNLNDYEYAKILDQFKIKVLDPHKKRTDEAFAIMSDVNHQWKDDAQKQAGNEKLEVYKAMLAFYEDLYNKGVKFCSQHENLTNKLSKFYDRWYNEVSNEGRQEKEMLSYQADVLNEIFSEIYTELKTLGLDIKPPKALNLV